MRVLFLAAPYKRNMIEEMTKFFTRQIDFEIYSPPAKKYDSTLIGLKNLIVREEIVREIHNFGPDVVYSDHATFACQAKFVSPSIPLILHLRGDWWT